MNTLVEASPSAQVARAIAWSPRLQKAREQCPSSRVAQDAFLALAARAEIWGVRGFVRTFSRGVNRSDQQPSVPLAGNRFKRRQLLNSSELQAQFDNATIFLEANLYLRYAGLVRFFDQHGFGGADLRFQVSTRGAEEGVSTASFTFPDTDETVEATEVSAVFSGDQRTLTEGESLELHFGQDPDAITSQLESFEKAKQPPRPFMSSEVNAVLDDVSIARRRIRKISDRISAAYDRIKVVAKEAKPFVPLALPVIELAIERILA